MSDGNFIEKLFIAFGDEDEGYLSLGQVQKSLSTTPYSWIKNLPPRSSTRYSLNQLIYSTSLCVFPKQKRPLRD